MLESDEIAGLIVISLIILLGLILNYFEKKKNSTGNEGNQKSRKQINKKDDNEDNQIDAKLVLRDFYKDKLYSSQSSSSSDSTQIQTSEKQRLQEQKIKIQMEKQQQQQNRLKKIAQKTQQQLAEQSKRDIEREKEIANELQEKEEQKRKKEMDFILKYQQERAQRLKNINDLDWELDYNQPIKKEQEKEQEKQQEKEKDKEKYKEQEKEKEQKKVLLISPEYIQSTISQIQASYQTCCLHDTDVQAQIEARKLALEMLPELKEYGVSEYLPAIGDWKEKVMKLKSKKQRQKWGKVLKLINETERMKKDIQLKRNLISDKESSSSSSSSQLQQQSPQLQSPQQQSPQQQSSSSSQQYQQSSSSLQQQTPQQQQSSSSQQQQQQQSSSLSHSNISQSPLPIYIAFKLCRKFQKTFTFIKFDKIKCDYCGNDALIHNRRQITQEDRQRVGIPLEWRCTRVETYKCIACNQDNLFYRYNNPIQIMKEKKGRCGEFANVFTLICKSIGFHSRLVDDVSSGGGDHVWTEIYDESGLGKKMDEMMNDEQEMDEQNKQEKDKQELEQNEQDNQEQDEQDVDELEKDGDEQHNLNLGRSSSQQIQSQFTYPRFIHFDPCEGLGDNPILYEKGWKKNVNKVIAIGGSPLSSECLIFDVTPRYTENNSIILLGSDQPMIMREGVKQQIEMRSKQDIKEEESQDKNNQDSQQNYPVITRSSFQWLEQELLRINSGTLVRIPQDARTNIFLRRQEDINSMEQAVIDRVMPQKNQLGTSEEQRGRQSGY